MVKRIVSISFSSLFKKVLQKKMFLTWSSFKDISKVKYLQNLWCYMDTKRKKNNCNEFDIFDEYISEHFVSLYWLPEDFS